MASKVMKTTVAMTCLKTFLGIFTGILWVVGAVLLGVGIYSKIKLGNYNVLSSIDFSSAPYVLIGIGVFIVLVGFFGCCAIGQGNTCMLRTYAFALGVLFIAEIGGAISAIILRGKVSDSFRTGMTDAIKSYTNNSDSKAAVDQAQADLECCGVHNYTDYWYVANWTALTLPKSCCAANQTVCDSMSGKTDIMTIPNGNPSEELVYASGCPDLVFHTVDSNLGIVLGVMFGVAAFQLLGVILSCGLASNINANKYELV